MNPEQSSSDESEIKKVAIFVVRFVLMNSKLLFTTEDRVTQLVARSLDPT